MTCHPDHPPPGPHLDADSFDALEIALCALTDWRPHYPWRDLLEEISMLASLALEAQSQISLRVEQAINHGYSWTQIRKHLGLPDPYTGKPP